MLSFFFANACIVVWRVDNGNMANEEGIPINLPTVAALPDGYRSIDELQRGGELEERIGKMVAFGSVAAVTVVAAANKLRGKNADTPQALVVGALAVTGAVSAIIGGRRQQADAEFLRLRQAEGVVIIPE